MRQGEGYCGIWHRQTMGQLNGIKIPFQRHLEGTRALYSRRLPGGDGIRSETEKQSVKQWKTMGRRVGGCGSSEIQG